MRALATTGLLAVLLSLASAQVPDSAAAAGADSLRAPVVPIPLVGSVDRELDPAEAVTSEAMPYLEYRTLADLLGRQAGAFTRDPASVGLGTGLTLRGAGARSIAVLADGVALNDPMSGAFNLSLYPTEQIERIEIVPATRAFLYAHGGADGLVNLVSKSKKAIVPQSRIRYSEGPHGYGFIDGTVSQDVLRGLNVTAGAQHVTFDQRFANTSYDAWTTHVKARYNLSNDVNAFATLLVNGTELGLNGGVDPVTPDSSRFDELVAAVVNTDAYEKVTRTDLQLGAAFRPAFDSTGVHTVTAFLTTALREYRDEENRPLPNGILAADDHRTQWFGVRWLHERSLAGQHLQLGAEIVTRDVVASPSTGSRRATAKAAFGLLALRLVPGIALTAYARAENDLGRTRLSAGTDAAATLTCGLTLTGGFSRSYRFPSFQESSWNDDLVTSSGITTPERHDLLEAGVRFGGEGTRLGVTLYRRVVRDAIVLAYDAAAAVPYAFAGGTREAVNGLSVDAQARLSWLSLEGRLEELDRGRTTSARLPDWWAECGAYYRDSLIGGHLRLKAGFRGTAAAAFAADGFDERRLLYLAAAGGAAPPAATLDLVVIAAIGDATIHLLWENLLSRDYLATYLYPMEGRAFRFGVNWDFLN